MKKIIQILIISVLFTACANGSTNNSKIKIVCTTNIIAEGLTNIVPESFDVKALMGPGVDPHSYKSKTQDLKDMNNADILIYNGLHLEMNLMGALQQLSTKKFVINMGKSLPEEQLIQVADFANAYDPHFWHNVELFKLAIQNAAKQIASTYPTHKNYIDSAANNYIQKLTELHSWNQTQINKIPAKKRVLITAHDAFNYYGATYGIEVVGVQGISTASDISIRGITNLTNEIVSKQIPAVFIENSVSDKNIKSVIEGCKSKGLNLKQGGILYSDGLGDSLSNADTYIKMIKANTTTIVKALAND
jgi:manganese/zinc/iron transport system substrate-binding protein